MKPVITLLIPLCSRNMKINDFKSTPLYKAVIPQFKETIEPSLYEYRIFFGIDEDDEFYLKHQNEIQELYDNVTIVVLKHCQHRPVRAWNILFDRAFHSGSDYFLQIGDDVVIETPGWTSIFIEQLQKQDNIGTIAPCELINYNIRINQKKCIINENNFVHRTHYEIFEYFFYPDIINWYCDNWITCIYDEKAYMSQQVTCKNLIRDSRYSIQQCDQLMQFIIEGKNKISKYIRKQKSNININNPFKQI